MLVDAGALERGGGYVLVAAMNGEVIESGVVGEAGDVQDDRRSAES